MKEEESEPKRLFLAGPYEVVQTAEGIKLQKLDPEEEQFPDAETLVFEGEEEAEVVAHMLGRAFQKGYGAGESGINVGNSMRVEFYRRGDEEYCKIKRLNEGKVVGRPIKATSPQKLINALTQIYGRQK